ncbi:hypothetical protein CPC08DRAFT_121236 [Agrocybe pediades]|nr:hypothetical protein CPC08DRAFT_121236 [Agrocybe pediades]
MSMAHRMPGRNSCSYFACAKRPSILVHHPSIHLLHNPNLHQNLSTVLQTTVDPGARRYLQLHNAFPQFQHSRDPSRVTWRAFSTVEFNFNYPRIQRFVSISYHRNHLSRFLPSTNWNSLSFLSLFLFLYAISFTLLCSPRSLC